jgi:hypothetical protein
MNSSIQYHIMLFLLGLLLYQKLLSLKFLFIIVFKLSEFSIWDMEVNLLVISIPSFFDFIQWFICSAMYVIILYFE